MKFIIISFTFFGALVIYMVVFNDGEKKKKKTHLKKKEEKKLCIAHNSEAVKDCPTKQTELLRGPGVYNRSRY